MVLCNNGCTTSAGYFGQRQQCKPALRQVGMWHRQQVGIYNQVTYQQNIKINGTRSHFKVRRLPILFSIFSKICISCAGIQRCADGKGLVVKRRLIGKPQAAVS